MTLTALDTLIAGLAKGLAVENIEDRTILVTRDGAFVHLQSLGHLQGEDWTR